MPSRPSSPRLAFAFVLIGLLSIGLLWALRWPVSGAKSVAVDAPASLAFAPPDLVVRAGELVSVEVRISDIVGLYGADVRIKFDPQSLQVEDADLHATGVQVTAGNAPQPDFLLRRVADNEAGTVWYAATSVSPTLPFSGTGTIVTIAFRGQAEGTSAIEFTYHKLVQRTGLPSDYTVGPASQVQVLPVTSTPTPTTTLTPTVTPTPSHTPTPTASPTQTTTPVGGGSKRLHLPLILRL